MAQLAMTTRPVLPTVSPRPVPNIGQKAFAEFFGSMTLVVAAISPVILAHHLLAGGVALAVLMDAVAVAFVLFVLIEVLGPVSSCHLNPAVTVSMVVSGQIDLGTGGVYLVAQFAGGLAGTAVSHLMFFDKHLLPLLAISSTVRSGGAYVAEMLGTFMLVLVIHGCRVLRSDHTAPIVALLVGGLLIATSSTMFANPQMTLARMFTASIAGVRPLDGLIFIAIQMVAALVATRTAVFLFRDVGEGSPEGAP